MVAGIGWQGLLAAGGYLVGHNLKHATEVYGFFATVLGLLSWLYLGSELTLYAAEVNVVLTRRLWPRSILQPPLTGPDQRALVDLAKQEERRPEQSIEVRFAPKPMTPRATGPRTPGVRWLTLTPETSIRCVASGGSPRDLARRSSPRR